MPAYPRLGAILATHGIEGAQVLRMSSEAAALDAWRQELAAGNRIACLGTASADEEVLHLSVLDTQEM